jgi:GntR family transcriptional regulator/MocR family aminotransferase
MIRIWDINVQINHDSPLSIHQQLFNNLVEEITSGRLPPGYILPGSRTMAQRLSLNRKTVIFVIDELVAQGWLTSVERRGTCVSKEIPKIAPQISVGTNHLGKVIDSKSAVVFRLRKNSLDLSLVYKREGKGVFFDDGEPDARLMPTTELSKNFRIALNRGAKTNFLGYGDPKGNLDLRKAISTMLNIDRGIPCDEENVCVVRGSQMGIFLAGKLLIEPGDAVVIEKLSYPSAWEAFRSLGAKIITVEMDDDGLDIVHLESICRKNKVKLVYITPHHHFPTTLVMPPPRRLRLSLLAAQFGFALVEDDYDHEFHFFHRPILPMASSGNFDRIIYIGSMSKLVLPSIRLGYVVAAKEVIDRIANDISLIDRQGDPALEIAVSTMLNAGYIRKHTKVVRQIYMKRRDHLVGLLKSTFRDNIIFNIPDGGLAIWVKFPGDIDFSVISNDLSCNNIYIVPGSKYSADSKEVNALRIGFGKFNESEMEHAFHRLSNILNLYL